MLDTRDQPIAEVCRRVGEVATRLALPRPSYVHVRRLVHAERERQDAERESREQMRQLVADVFEDVLVGRRVDAYEVADRAAAARRRAR